MKGIADGLEQARQSVGVGRGRSEGSMSKSSADALELESEDKRSILSDISGAAQDFERRHAETVMAYRTGGKPKVVIQYPTDFNLRSLQAEIDEATSLKSLTVSPEVNLAMVEGIVRRKFANLPPNELTTLVGTLKAAMDKALADAEAMKASISGKPGGGAPGAFGKPAGDKPDPGDAMGANPDETAPGDTGP